MAVRGGIACIRMFLMVFNSLLCLCGLMLLIFGFWLCIDSWQMEDSELEPSSTSFSFGLAVFFLMAVGAFVMFLGAVGCFGAGLEALNVLEMYFALLLSALVVELIVAVVSIVEQDWVVATLQDLHAHVYIKFLKTEKTSLGLTLMVLHHALDCCGSRGLVDQLVAHTCPARSGLAVFTLQSCSSTITALFEQQGHVVYAAWIGLIMVTILAMVFSVVLWARIRRSGKR
ncbi:CD9 antigen-like [Rhinatrema bivittatum]|uniref:CD9 antigen-like n=1 Tax=Rhinatrema bivittatum TaxID=194408 RepID=UPI0011260F0F|nr:CD9 antigen-like [Rhinatrema bivittatum]